MTKPIIMGNWKMNSTLAESEELIRQLARYLPIESDIEVAVFPPFTALERVSKFLPAGVALGAQNVYPAVAGAFTGEISTGMIQEIGCSYVLVGHSERRHIMGEPAELIADKVLACVSSGLTPVLCVGETLAERQQGVGNAVVTRQLVSGLSKLPQASVPLLVAYEPVWAIGTGQAASPEQAETMLRHIRHVLDEALPKGSGIRLLYGGSVTPANMREFAERPIIDGALVGGVSLKADQFAELVKVLGDARKRL